jgi:hypothetical protein
MDIKELENAVFTKSVPYRDSTAFRNALHFIKMNDLSFYKTLLEKECDEMGFEDFDEDFS